MLRQFDRHVIDAAYVIVDTYGEAGRQYLAEAVAVAIGSATPGRLEDLAMELPKHRTERGAPRPVASTTDQDAP